MDEFPTNCILLFLVHASRGILKYQQIFFDSDFELESTGSRNTQLPNILL